MTGNGTGTGKQYMGFVRGNMDQITKKITDDLWVLGVMEVSGIDLIDTSLVRRAVR